jgi:hypothetical protein
MIDLGSIAGLHEHNHELRAYCPRCDRWAVLPLAALANWGKEAMDLQIMGKCRACGGSRNSGLSIAPDAGLNTVAQVFKY